MTAENESWGAFWDEVTGGEQTEVIRGVRVPVPTDVPLAFEKRREELADSDAFEDYAELVGLLFGADVMTDWVKDGMGLRELQTVFTWGMAHGSGEDVTFREAYDMVQRGEADEADGGKPAAPAGANRAERRAAQKKPSGSTGGRSKRTSSGSTASARTTSPA